MTTALAASSLSVAERAARRASTTRKIVTSLILIAVGGFALRLSFDAQVALAVAAAIPAELAPFYPLMVDIAIVGASLIAIWYDGAGRSVKGYALGSLAFWTVVSVAGNAGHVILLPDEDLGMDRVAAIVIGAIPPVTLFLIGHLSLVTVFAGHETPAGTARPRTRAPRTRSTAAPSPAPAPSSRGRTRSIDIDDAHLVQLADRGMTMRAISDETGISKSAISRRIRIARGEIAA